MPFVNLSTIPEKEIIPGYRVRFVHCDSMTMAYWSIDTGAALPEHSHPHEQVATLTEGEYELSVGDKTKVLRPGDVAVIPPNVPHSGRALSDCCMIDAFHPVREDYL